MFCFISKGSEKCCHKTVFALLDHVFLKSVLIVSCCIICGGGSWGFTLCDTHLGRQ